MRVKPLRKNQDGLVSIMIVVIIISLVTVITIGFARIIRREQRQALDQQISSQARYAAESAINKKIAQYRSDPASLTTTTGCVDQGQTFSAGTEIQTTCVLVDTDPGELQYDQVKTSESTMVWLDPGGTPLDRLVITWQNVSTVTDNDCQTTPYTNLPTNIGGTQIGMLRFDLARVGEPSATFNRNDLLNRNFGGVLYPKQGGTEALAYDPSTSPVVYGTCGSPAPSGVDEPLAAHAIITLPADASTRNSRFILRLKGIYRNSQVRVMGFKVGSDEPVEFVDSQISIEATARVADVVQRIRVSVPAGLPPRALVPDDAIHVVNGGLCKLVETEPGSTVNNCDAPGYVLPTP